MANKVKQVAAEEAQHVASLAHEAARSGTYLYPFKGVMYFLSHPSLWRPLTSRLAPTLTLGTIVTLTMFFVTYIPQMAMLAIVNGPLAAITTIFLVLSESSTLTTILSKTFLIEDALTDTFDGTLVSKNMIGTVSQGRQIKTGGDPVARLGKLIKKPFAKFTPRAIIRYFIYLPLNFVPVVGTVLFVVLQAKRYGPRAHERYFQLKDMSRHQRQEFIEKHRAAYTSFGVPAVLLEMIPVAGILFTFTNAVGAALWAASLEQDITTAPNLRAQIKKTK